MAHLSRTPMTCLAVGVVLGVVSSVVADDSVTPGAAVPAPAAQEQASDLDSSKVYTLDPVFVRGRIDDLSGIARSASEGRVGQQDLQNRPLSREGEILESVPGLILTQHSGDGKSNQMFLRGFNLDHGTDFATVIEGMPLNLPTHGHGHGYTDLNFLVPELIDHVEFKKGVYYSEEGDFSSAGAAHLRLSKSLARPFLKAELGENAFVRAVGAGSRPAGPGVLLVASELKGYNGPWDRSEDLDKASGMARYSWKTGRGDNISFLALGYHNDWSSSDQVPLREVESGSLSSFGQVDTTLGGATDRYSLAAQWAREGASSTLRANVYAIDYKLDLFSNFTYFLADTTVGDQFEQVDDRSIFGGAFESLSEFTALARRQRLKLGFQTRTDVIEEVGLYQTEARRRVGTLRDDSVVESNAGLYADVSTPWTDRFRTNVGLRSDVFLFDVESHSIAENSGQASEAIVSPKLGAAFTVNPNLEFYANAGLGFHSNDARGATIAIDPATGDPASPVDPLVRSRGAEVGFRVQAAKGLRSTVSLWALHLDSELVFVGDGGTTEPNNGSERSGIEFANYWEPTRSFAVDVDVAFSRGRFLDVPESEDHIPGALESVVAGGIRWDFPNLIHGGVRVRHLGRYALIEDNSIRSQPTTLVNLAAGRDFAGVRLDFELLNVFNENARDIQYYYASRLPGEPVDGVDDIHFHPVESRQVRVAATVPF